MATDTQEDMEEWLKILESMVQQNAAATAAAAAGSQTPIQSRKTRKAWGFTRKHGSGSMYCIV
jgi:hypothetical protein